VGDNRANIISVTACKKRNSAVHAFL